MYILGLLMLVGAAHGGIVKRAACSEPTHLTEDEILATLDAHNDARGRAGNQDAANEVKLTWNNGLASRAQDWANLCEWKHQLTTECDETTTVGQNLFMMGGGAVMPSVYDVAGFVQEWNEEKKDYSYEAGECAPEAVCGHYTQVVWAKTMEVGCGIARCPAVKVGDNPVGFTNAIVFGCNYSPPGNYNGQKPYLSGIPCSSCNTVITGKGWMCNRNLCRPCTPGQDGASCQCEAKVCENGGNFDPDQCACSCPVNFYGETCENRCACADVESYAAACPSWNAFCTDPMYQTFMKTNCPAQCGMCDLPASCNQP